MKKIAFVLISFYISSIGTLSAQAKKVLTNEIKTPKDRSLIASRIKPKLHTGGYAEVFIHIPQDYISRYKISIGDQSVENSTGHYRFFDLAPGKYSLTILEYNIPIYKTTIYLKNKVRTILDFLPYEGLYILDEMPLEYYTLPSKSSISLLPVMNAEDFSVFLKHFKNQSFDSDKKALFLVQNKNTAFLAEQILDLIKHLNYDETKLEIAKAAYHNCPNPQQYYLLSEEFSFSSSKKALMDFIQQQP